MKRLQEVAGFLRARVIGDATVELTGVSSIRSASPGDVVFVETEKNLQLAVESGAAAVIAGDFAAERVQPKPLLIAEQPRLAFARAAQFLSSAPQREPGVHPSAAIERSARLGKNASVGARSVLAEGVTIGEATQIGAGCV